jgi:hypothetical protein
MVYSVPLNKLFIKINNNFVKNRYITNLILEYNDIYSELRYNEN